jgi:hypothetical protein
MHSHSIFDGALGLVLIIQNEAMFPSRVFILVSSIFLLTSIVIILILTIIAFIVRIMIIVIVLILAIPTPASILSAHPRHRKGRSRATAVIGQREVQNNSDVSYSICCSHCVADRVEDPAGLKAGESRLPLDQRKREKKMRKRPVYAEFGDDRLREIGRCVGQRNASRFQDVWVRIEVFENRDLVVKTPIVALHSNKKGEKRLPGVAVSDLVNRTRGSGGNATRKMVCPKVDPYRHSADAHFFNGI